MFADACDDPVDLLKRIAAQHGTMCLEAVTGNHCGTFDDVDDFSDDEVRAFLSHPERVTIDTYIAGFCARLAWRYALAAVALRGAWRPIETAPHDRVIVAYAPGREDLPPMASLTFWHPDAGFCIDELREPTQWTDPPTD